MPACPVSETTTPLAGSACMISRQMRSGRRGEASDDNIGSAAARHSATCFCASACHAFALSGALRCAVSHICRSVTLASPSSETALG